jgi:hypothetical protein
MVPWDHIQQRLMSKLSEKIPERLQIAFQLLEFVLASAKDEIAAENDQV